MLARLLLAMLIVAPAAAEPFSFVALGDTTYAIPADHPLYARLIDTINAAQPAFSIHVGAYVPRKCRECHCRISWGVRSWNVDCKIGRPP